MQWSAAGIEIDLEHVVSRVTVITTSYFVGSETWPFIVTVPTVYSKYNVETEKVVEDSKVPGGYILNVTDGEYDVNAEVGHFYVLGSDEIEQELTLQYKGPKRNPEIEFSNVPLLANYHITLMGDICNAGLVSGIIKATVSEDWPNSSNKPF